MCRCLRQTSVVCISVYICVHACYRTVCICAHVCAVCSFSVGHTRTCTAQMGYSIVSPGVGMKHLEGPKNPDGLNLGIYVSIYVSKVHMCMYMLRGGMRSWTNCFFLLICLLRRVEDVTTISKPQPLISVKIKHCTLRVPNKTCNIISI